MPQARFLGRRWRLATDSLPLLFYPLLRTLSIVLFVLLLSLVGVTLTSNYQCQAFAKVAVAMYGMTVIYFIGILIATFLVRLGWRGGPLNERKRMPQMAVMIHAWFIVEVVKFGFTLYGIYVVYSSSVESQCWSSNPCRSYADQLPKVCVPGASGDVQLTQECQVIFKSKKKYNSCFDEWASIGAGWMLDNFISENRESNPPYANFSYPGMVTCDTGINWENDPRLSDINPFDAKESIFKYLAEELERIDEEQQQESPQNISLVDILPNAYQLMVEAFINNGMTIDKDSNDTTGIPWNECLGGSCFELLQNSCSQWRDFISLPDTHGLAGWFAAIMFISLAECILTGLIFFFSFNAFPDYDSEESWQGLLSGMAKRLGYGGDLQATSTDNGVDALVGIGGVLYNLFGGADLDVTDVILGLYLVHLRQKWKRKKHALSYLAKHGYVGKERQVSVWLSKVAAFIVFPLFIDGYYKGNRGSAETKDKHEGSKAPTTTRDDIPDDVLLNEFSSEIKHVRKDWRAGSLDGSDRTIHLQHSFVLLDSKSQGRCAIPSTNAEKIVLSEQKRALITPLNLRHVTFQIDGESVGVSEDVLGMYLGNANPRVESEDLETLLHFLPIARASYGLIKCKWRSCIEPQWKHKMLSNMLHFSKDCLPKSTVSSYFQRRNLEQILRMVNIRIEDVLYVSYRSNPLGEIPYLILRDKSTKNVCVSMRGTVGVADLITDLLSSPEKFPNDSQDIMYAHAGMMSSAQAMINDFKSKGIWDALCDYPLQPETAREFIDLPQEDEDEEFPLSKALKCIRKAMRDEGYGLVITGHSLGAGVASLVASEMRKIRPLLKCFAYNPPGGLFDEVSRKKSESFCTSVVCGQDAISRLSIGTMKRLLDDMMFALASCKRPKLSILFDSMIGRYSNSDAAAHIFDRFGDIEPYIMNILEQYLEKSKMHQENVDDQAMYPPGNLIFLRPYGDVSNSRSITWDAVWIKAYGTNHMQDDS